jgi:hypothetical protein
MWLQFIGQLSGLPLLHSEAHTSTQAIPTALCLLLLPCPILFIKYGARIRKSCKYAAKAAAIYEQMTKKDPKAPQEPKADQPLIAENEKSRRADV